MLLPAEGAAGRFGLADGRENYRAGSFRFIDLRQWAQIGNSREVVPRFDTGFLKNI